MSATNSGSHLLKARWFPNDQWQVAASWINFTDQGLQAYDATAGVPGSFGKVIRRIEDDTLSLRAQWQDAERANQWKLTVGQSHTQVQDHMPKGYSVFSSAYDTDDNFRYTNSTVDTQGTLRISKGPASRMDLRLGLQWGQQQRTIRRVTGNEAFNQAVYPDGFNSAQPSGSKHTKGLYLQPDWHWGRLQVMPGVRWDEIEVDAAGKTLVELAKAGQSSMVTYQRTTPSLNLSFDLVPQRWTTFAQVGQAFRPPLVDEVFTQGPYGRCLNYLLIGGTDPLPGYTEKSQVAPSSGICGDLYRPETSRTMEWGMSVRQPGFLGQRVTLKNNLSAKLTFFRNRTDHLLESILAASGGSGVIVQEGWERRHGAELEAAVDIGPVFSSLAASRIRGDSFDGRQAQPLTSAPADSVYWSLGWRWADVEAMVRVQRVSRRLTVVDTVNNVNVIGQQEGYELLGMSVRWNVNRHLSLNLSGENLGNATYHLSSGFGGSLGTQAAGRNVRVAATAIY
jgi:hemoglobin/transferrin/lactoferrin receptor protein